MSEYNDYIINYLRQEVSTIFEVNTNEIDKAIHLLLKAEQNKNHIYCFGNGGSAATASHFQNDFNKGIDTRKFQFCCLNDNIATIMAIANDISYDDIFIYQLQRILQPNDVILAISGSGNSTNIIKAATYAKEQGNTIIGLTGFDGGRLKSIADISLHVPINNMQIVEDIHLLFNHLMMSTIKFIDLKNLKAH